jgi:hypothetical protein
VTNYESQRDLLARLIFNLEYYLELKEMEALGLTPEELIGALEVMIDNNPAYLQTTGKS